MSHLLDTNICTAHFRRPGGLCLIGSFSTAAGFMSLPSSSGSFMPVPTIVINPAPLLQQIADLLVDVKVLDFDYACAEKFGRVRGRLLQTRISVPTTDLMIAAVALVHNLTLVTNNTADFQNVPGLRLDDWLTP
jgi:tRNA(fMet)-specific endonuclease VapC